jgi:hypothetical protein
MTDPLVEPKNEKAVGSRNPSRSGPTELSTVSIDAAIKENNRLLRQLASETVRLVVSKDVPLIIKCFLIPLLVIIPTFSGELVILVADSVISYKLGRAGINVRNYLFFLGAMVVLYFIAAFAFAQVSIKFQNAEELREQLTTVTNSRRVRNRVRNPPHPRYENLC